MRISLEKHTPTVTIINSKNNKSWFGGEGFQVLELLYYYYYLNVQFPTPSGHLQKDCLIKPTD